MPSFLVLPLSHPRHKAAHQLAPALVLHIEIAEQAEYYRAYEVNKQILHSVVKANVKITSKAEALTIHRHVVDVADDDGCV